MFLQEVGKVLGNAYWLRDLTNKAVRRIKKVLGRPDPRPWVLRPAQRQAREAYADLVVALDFINNDAPLTRMFQEAVAPYGLSLLIANHHNVAQLTREIARGRTTPLVLLDLCSAVHPQFGQLLRAAHEAGVYTIGQPEQLDLWTWKARAHPRLIAAGLPVPPTILIPAGQPTPELSAEQRTQVGDKCVIKPSWGVAGKGVLAGVKPTIENINMARQFNPADDYLVQRMIRWERLGGRAGYLRGYNVMGCRSLLWWSPETQQYDLCTWEDLRQFQLMPAVELMDRLARLTGMDFFSTEIAITAATGPQRMVLIDYVNDQCDMNPASAQAGGPPDEWVQWVCRQIAQFIWRRKHDLPQSQGHSLWLPRRPGEAAQPAAQLISAA